MGDDLAHRRGLHAQSRPPARTCSTANTSSNAQGEDVVAGVRTPKPVADNGRRADVRRHLHSSCSKVRQTLEKKFGDVQDFEFTVEKKQALHAADAAWQADGRCAYVKIAARHGRAEAHDRRACDPVGRSRCLLDSLLAPIFDRADYEAAKKGGRCSPRACRRPGAATGQLVCSTPRRPRSCAEQGREGRPRPRGDEPGGSPRHDRRRGHPHQSRRRVQSHAAARGPRRWARSCVGRRRRRSSIDYDQGHARV